MLFSRVTVLSLVAAACGSAVDANGKLSSPALRGDANAGSFASIQDRRTQSNIAVPKLVGDWTRMIDFPEDVIESHGALLGCDLISVGGFFPNFASGPRSAYTMDLCDPTAEWEIMAEHPQSPFLTHAAQAYKGDNLFYTCGGFQGTHPGKDLSGCYVFDKTDGPIGSWKTMPALPERRGGGGMVYIESQNKLLFALGARRTRYGRAASDKDGAWTLDLSGVNLTDPGAGAQWQSRPGGSPYLGNHVTATMAKDCSGNERYFFMGGQVNDDEMFNNIDLVYEYIPSNDTFVQKQNMPEPRGHFTAAIAPYGCGFITVGGAINGDPTVNSWSDDILYYDIDSDTWTKIGTYPELIKSAICGITADVLSCVNGGFTVNSYQVGLSFDTSSTAANTTIMPTSMPTSEPTTVPTSMPVTSAPTTMPTTSIPTSTPVSPASVSVIIDTDLSTDGGFVQRSDVFRNTNNPTYSGGWYSASKQWMGVFMGGVDNMPVTGMSAARQITYTLPTDAMVTVEFSYRVIFQSDFEEGEDTEVLCSVDGTTYVVETFLGTDSPTTTDFKTASVNLGTQSAGGPYMFSLGGYLSQKNDSAERVRIVFDDIYMTATELMTTSPPTVAPAAASASVVIIDTDFSTNDFDGHMADAFYNTNSRPYAGGWYSSSRQWIGVFMGGVDNSMVTGMSSGQKTSYMLATDAIVTVAFSYRVIFQSDFEAGEDTEVLCRVDDTAYVVETFLGADSPTTTEFKTATINLGAQSAGGPYEFVLGGYLSQKNDSNERVRIVFDDVYMTASELMATSPPTMDPASVAALVVIDTDFSTNDFDGVQTDVFRSTSNPDYAGGWYSASKEWIGVFMGGVDDMPVTGMSAGQTTSYILPMESAVTVEFSYRVLLGSDLEMGEDVEVLCSVDGTTYVVETFLGADSPTTTAFMTATIDIGVQSAGGPYDLVLGGHLSQKNESAERVRIVFDDVKVTATPTM